MPHTYLHGLRGNERTLKATLISFYHLGPLLGTCSSTSQFALVKKKEWIFDNYFNVIIKRSIFTD